MVDSTVKYYNENAKKYYDNTVEADVTELYKPFIKHLKSGASILDAGCGSGRDSLFFKNKGYKVTAFDGSDEMVRLSSELLDQDVLLLRFEDVNFPPIFDGIWACSSLLHVARENLASVINKLAAGLKVGGVFYMSFKYGNREFTKDGRYFNCMDEDYFEEMMSKIPELEIESLHITEDVRPGRATEMWLNAYVVKV